MPIGFQGYDARFLLTKDWDQGWLELRNMGFQSVDLVSFKGYGYEHSPLADFPAKKIRDKLNSIGMICENCQYYFAELHGSFDEKMAFSHELGLKNIICAPDSGRMKTVDDWKWQAEQLNELGGKVKQAGFQLGYHNHNQEFLAIDGVIPYDVLMDRTDPALVKFQIDVGNLTFAGGGRACLSAQISQSLFLHACKGLSAGQDQRTGWAGHARLEKDIQSSKTNADPKLLRRSCGLRHNYSARGSGQCVAYRLDRPTSPELPVSSPSSV